MTDKTSLDKCLDFIEDPRDVDVIWHTMTAGRKELTVLRARIAELEAALKEALMNCSIDNHCGGDDYECKFCNKARALLGDK